MKFHKFFLTIVALAAMLALAGCDHIDNKAVPAFIVRINLADFGRWNTYGVAGVGDYRIFNRNKNLPSQFPYDVNTYTGYGGVLLMMGIDGPMAYDLACPVGGPTRGVAINSKLGMRKYRVTPSMGGYMITN